MINMHRNNWPWRAQEPPTIDLRPPKLRWPLLADHFSAPEPVVRRRQRLSWRERLVTVCVLLVLATVGAVLGVMWPL